MRVDRGSVGWTGEAEGLGAVDKGDRGTRGEEGGDRRTGGQG